MSRRPNGFWNDKGNVRRELRRVCDELGHFPSQRDLKQIGETTLATQIPRHYGSINEARKEMGYEDIKRPMGYWQNFDNVEQEMQPVIDQLGHFPTQKELADVGRKDLLSAVNKYHGGVNGVREQMGYEVEHSRKPRGTWKDLDFTIAEAKRVLDELGLDRLPGDRRLGELGYGSLGHAIISYHGGFHQFRRLLGDESVKGRWKDLEFCVQTAREVIEGNDLESLPGGKALQEMGQETLYTSIVKYHGGMRRFREILGEAQKEKEKGVWQEQEYALAEARQVMDEHELDELPSSNKLKEMGCSALATAIVRYHGGFRVFRALLGQDQKEREKGSWQSLDYTLTEAQRIMDEEGWDRLPATGVLTDHGYSSLAQAIVAYHGGFFEFRQELGEDSNRRRNGSWKDLEFAVSQAIELMGQHGLSHLPGQIGLGKLGNSVLGYAISRYHGGFPKFREILAARLGIEGSGDELETLLGAYTGGEDNGQ